MHPHSARYYLVGSDEVRLKKYYYNVNYYPDDPFLPFVYR